MRQQFLPGDLPMSLGLLEELSANLPDPGKDCARNLYIICKSRSKQIDTAVISERVYGNESPEEKVVRRGISRFVNCRPPEN